MPLGQCGLTVTKIQKPLCSASLHPLFSLFFFSPLCYLLSVCLFVVLLISLRLCFLSTFCFILSVSVLLSFSCVVLLFPCVLLFCCLSVLLSRSSVVLLFCFVVRLFSRPFHSSICCLSGACRFPSTIYAGADQQGTRFRRAMARRRGKTAKLEPFCSGCSCKEPPTSARQDYEVEKKEQRQEKQ